MSLILKQRQGSIVTLTFNDPATLNAMSQAMSDAFHHHLEDIKNDASVRVVILTGAGKAFSSGGHTAMLKHIGTLSDKDADLALQNFYRNFLAIRDLSVPVLAAINGVAIGAAFCVAIACDLKYAARSAKLGANFAKIGLSPGMGATFLLQKQVGACAASELLLTGKILSAEEALSYGLINNVFADAELQREVFTIANEIANLAPLAVSKIKQGIKLAETATLETVFATDAKQQAECLRSLDFAEGIEASLKKRQPNFAGK